ncbi:hypothetical protein RM479_22715 [Nocardiopsis sp. DSM 44743]|uniref:Uncharacterized protein n=1 Tax=Nocardiopsis lambiniae TaxID=3075539 RepID=A0ABU2MHB1_9ACTN|nr:hypothetical protein [Nocardiopsis sp. DSM 44743]MDT0331236.1 hypothetical protein [Nocardiopsis sp. DSM 44743]
MASNSTVGEAPPGQAERPALTVLVSSLVFQAEVWEFQVVEEVMALVRQSWTWALVQP